MRLFHILLSSSMLFPPCPLYKLLGLDEEVGEVSLGLICRTLAQTLNKEGFEEQKREGKMWGRKKGFSLSSPPMEKHPGGQTRKPQNTIDSLIGLRGDI